MVEFVDEENKGQVKEVHEDGDEEEEEEEIKNIFGGCGPMKDYPVMTVILCAAIGIAAGVGLSFWDPNDANTKTVTLQWIGLIGDMFIRALKCVVLPLVFVNVIISVVDMMSVGKASIIGGKVCSFWFFFCFFLVFCILFLCVD